MTRLEGHALPDPDARLAPELSLHRFGEFAALTPAEGALVRALGEPPSDYPRHKTIRREGERPDAIFLLVSGWVLSSLLLPSGDRQIVKVHLPGDMMGVPSMALGGAAETLTALTPATVSRVPHEKIGEIFTRAPRVAALLFLSAQHERVALMDALASVGRTPAVARLAVVLLSLHDRLAAITGIPRRTFAMPLTQTQLGDLTGLTSVHVSRTLRELERLGLIARTPQTITLHDIDALKRICGGPARALVAAPDWLPAPLTP